MCMVFGFMVLSSLLLRNIVCIVWLFVSIEYIVLLSIVCLGVLVIWVLSDVSGLVVVVEWFYIVMECFVVSRLFVIVLFMVFRLIKLIFMWYF